MAQKMEEMVTVPIEPRHKPLMQLAAQMEDRPLSNWARKVMLDDLREKGLIDDAGTPIMEEFKA